MQSSNNFYEVLKNLGKSTIIAFVKEREGMTETMKKIYEQTKEICDADIRRMSPEEVLMIRNAVLTLNPHIFILNNFNGEVFNYLANIENNHIILGVPFMQRLFESKDESIEAHHRQVFNAAFNGLTLCISNIRSAEKKEIAKTLKFMNGKLSDKVDSTVTHLITNTTKSVKYLEAAASKISIYHYQWVQSVWKKCMKENDFSIRADSEQFETHKLPPFFDLKIACTGLSKKERNQIETLIEENGGEFCETYSSTHTDILLLKQKDSTNPKYQNAVKRKIPILKCEWVEESIKAGYSLAYEDFCFKSSIPRDSKQQKEAQQVNSSQADKSFDTSSVISVDDTASILSTSTMSSVSTLQRIPSVSTVSSNKLSEKENRKKSIEFIKNFAVVQLKKLDDFLDGYTFYLKDYPQEIFAKMRRIITRCGGSSVESLKERFSHILCYGDVNLKNLYKFIQEKNKYAIPIRAEWLDECLTKLEALPDTDYLIDLSEYEVQQVPSSPFTKNSINLVKMMRKREEYEKMKKMMPPPFKTETSSQNADDERGVELKQTLIEANHKKVKQPSATVNITKRKYSSDEEICALYLNTKRRKLFETN